MSPPCPLPYDMLLWQNVLFRNTFFHTYSCPTLIRDGILAVGQLLEDGSSLAKIAPTWRSIYRDTIAQLANQTFSSEGSRQAPCDLSSLLTDWQRSSALAPGGAAGPGPCMRPPPPSPPPWVLKDSGAGSALNKCP